MTIDEALNHLQNLKDKWGGDELLFLANLIGNSVKNIRPLQHIGMCPPTGQIYVGYQSNDNPSSLPFLEDFWD
jgi:hypothetical protein